MAIEVSQKKRKKIKAPQGLDIFFQAMIFFFVLVAGGYFFMLHLNTQAEEIKKDIKEEIARREAAVPEKEKMEERARHYSHLLEDFQTVIDHRYTISSFFAPFEGSTHPSVKIATLNVDPIESTVRIGGRGEDFIAVGQQFYAFKEREFIEEVSLVDLSTRREDDVITHIEFTFEIRVDEELFVKEPKENG